jgi:tight adherence protein B
VDAIVLLTAVTVAASIFAAALALQGRLTATRQVVQQRTLAGTTPAVGRAPILTIPRLEPLSERGRRIAFELERAGLALTVSEFMAVRIGSAVGMTLVAALAARALSFSSVLGILAAVLGFVVGYWLPGHYLMMRKRRRLAQVEDQMLEALVSMAKSMKAGVGLTQALEYASRDVGAPLGPELQRVVRELQLGADIEIVLDEMNRRIGSGDLEIASTAIVIQRRVGGNLSEILTNVANTIRERKGIRDELNALTAQQRLQGNMSALIPVAVACFFFAFNFETARLMFETTAGNIALAVGIFFELLGLWMVRKFAEIEV